MNKMYIEMPKDVEEIINKLTKAGFEAFAVGGCVRDTLLMRSPGDWDVTTSALPEQVKEIFPKTIDTGIQHGTVTVMKNKTGYEVTTYRIDGEYEDSRHPKSVEFTRNLTEDLKRRDFTINAMAYNHEAGIVDEFNGIEDLENRIIRCVGNPVHRFEEDALRMMRAVRFSAQLDFVIEQETFDAIVRLSDTIAKVSKERIQTELSKILVSNHPDYLMRLCDGGIMAVILPEVDEVLKSNKGKVVLRAMAEAENILAVRYGILLSSVGEEKAIQILKKLRLDNHTVNTASKIVRYADTDVKPFETDVRKAMHEMGKEIFSLVYKAKTALVKAKEKELGIPMLGRLNDINKVCRMYDTIIKRGDCIDIRDLALKGTDLIEHGIQPGAHMGEILDRLLMIVLEKPDVNNKEELIAIVENEL